MPGLLLLDLKGFEDRIGGASDSGSRVCGSWANSEP